MVLRFIWLSLLCIVSGEHCLRKCPFPGIPANAVVSWPNGTLKLDGFCAGDVVVFECDEGRRMPSHHSAAIMCQDDGKWNTLVPRCDRNSSWSDHNVGYYDQSHNTWVRVNISNPDIYEARMFRLSTNNNRISEMEVVTRHALTSMVQSLTVGNSICVQVQQIGNKFRFRCPLKGIQKNEIPVDVSLRIKSSLKSVSLLIHDATSCGFPPVPLNAITDDFDDFEDFNDTTVNYTCSDNFELVDESSVTCDVATGQWGEIPVCRANSSLTQEITTDLTSIQPIPEHTKRETTILPTTREPTDSSTTPETATSFNPEVFASFAGSSAEDTDTPAVELDTTGHVNPSFICNLSRWRDHPMCRKLLEHATSAESFTSPLPNRAHTDNTTIALMATTGAVVVLVAVVLVVINRFGCREYLFRSNSYEGYGTTDEINNDLAKLNDYSPFAQHDAMLEIIRLNVSAVDERENLRERQC